MLLSCHVRVSDGTLIVIIMSRTSVSDGMLIVIIMSRTS